MIGLGEGVDLIAVKKYTLPENVSVVQTHLKLQ